MQVLSVVMRGLDPRIHDTDAAIMAGGWVYIMTNRPNGTLYVGVTVDLVRRVWEHREGMADGFTKQYDLKRLVYFERHDEILFAIQREKAIKHWSRSWKVQLIFQQNATWNDLYESIL
jgi:putative endonuclease